MNCSTIDFIAAFDLRDTVTETAGDDVTTLWHSDFYDVARSGLCTTPQGPHWYHLVSDPYDDNTPLTYALIALTDDEAALEAEHHELFRKHVGTHCDHTVERGQRVVRPRDQHAKYYDHPSCDDARERRRRYLDRHITSWFQL